MAEEIKEDILDFKTLREKEESAIPFEEYLREHESHLTQSAYMLQ